MPKEVLTKYYAVVNGKEGPKIYTDYREYLIAAAMKTNHWSGGSASISGRSFSTYQEAQQWLDSSMESRTSTPKARLRTISSISSSPSPYPRSYPSDSSYDRPEKGSKYAEVGIQCEVPPLHSPKACVAGPSVAPVQAQPANNVVQILHSVKLSEEQLAVLSMVKTGQNVFFTGPAGTGKSVLLREIIRHLRQSSRLVAVTAPTGIAGINVGGSTVHSWAGIGLGKETEETLANRISWSKKLRERWVGTDVLVIDEISMLDGTLFDKLEYIGRFVRKNERPFGGMQLVLCGDFFQLPPVPEQSHKYRMPATFTFDALSWPKCISRPVFLTQVFRQKDDIFVSLLTSIRHGILTDKRVQLLESLVRPIHYDDGIEATELFPLRAEVEKCNNKRLAELQGPTVTYLSMDAAGWDAYRKSIPKESAESLLERLVAPPIITLKVGAQVMLIVNIEQRLLVNGSTGKVIDFLTHREAIERCIRIATPPPLHPQSGSDDLSPQTSPLPLQNSQKEGEQMEEEPLPEVCGTLNPITDHVFSKNEKWPLVEFTNGSLLLCSAMPFSVQGFLGNIEARRMQVPLILAWAMSIHKSQGQTLTRVKIDLSRAFEKGQAYVGLSRATAMEGLELCNFDPSRIQAHPRVIAWHSENISKQQSIDEEMDSEEAISRFWE